MKSLSTFLSASRVFHPFLFGVFFLLDNYLQLIGYITPVQTFVLLLVILGVVTLSHRLLTWLIKDAIRAGICTTIFIVLFLFFHNVSFGLVRLFEKTGIRVAHITTFRIIVVLIIAAVVLILIYRTRQNMIRFNLYLNVLGSILILFSFFQIGTFHDKFTGENFQTFIIDRENNIPGSESLKKPDPCPDIYYIVLDSYTSSVSLEKYWNYDNGDFISHLQKKGFVIASESRSNYNSTRLSIASTLNMSFLNHPRELNFEWPNGYFRSLDLIENNYVVKNFQTLGYQIYNLSIFDIVKIPRTYSAVTYIEKNSAADYIFNRTIFGTAAERLKLNNFYKVNLALLSGLKEIASKISNRPKFVYAHIFLPHHPYSFDHTGKVLPWWKRGNVENRESYLEQLIFTNKMIAGTIDTILSASKITPIIIIQGDHGYRYIPGEGKEAEGYTIFNAYLLPGGGDKKIYASITPVNSFRLIFNYYFDGNYKILNDKSFQVEPYSPTKELD